MTTYKNIYEVEKHAEMEEFDRDTKDIQTVVDFLRGL